MGKTYGATVIWEAPSGQYIEDWDAFTTPVPGMSCLVSVNSMEALKPDLLLEEKDKVVLRGSGRVILSEVGGSTRKDRIRVTYQVFR